MFFLAFSMTNFVPLVQRLEVKGLYLFYSSSVIAIGDFHGHNIISLQLPESSSFSLPCLNFVIPLRFR